MRVRSLFLNLVAGQVRQKLSSVLIEFWTCHENNPSKKCRSWWISEANLASKIFRELHATARRPGAAKVFTQLHNFAVEGLCDTAAFCRNKCCYIMLYFMPLISVQLLVSICSILPRCPFHQGSQPSLHQQLFPTFQRVLCLAQSAHLGDWKLWLTFRSNNIWRKKKLQDQNQHQNKQSTTRDWMMMMTTTTTMTMTMTMNTTIVRRWWGNMGQPCLSNRKCWFLIENAPGSHQYPSLAMAMGENL